jgi:hypothetical protein
LEYPAYGTGLASSDYHLFPALKQNPGGLRFKDDHAVKTIVAWWVIIEDTDWYQQGTLKLVPEYDTCSGGYEEKSGMAVQVNMDWYYKRRQQRTQNRCIVNLFSDGRSYLG